MKRAVIYGIVDQRLRFRYVGMTTKGMDVRARQHRNAATPLGEWMRANVWGSIQLQRCDPWFARLAERRWIARFWRAGYALFNVDSRPCASRAKVAVCSLCDRRADDPATRDCTHTDCGLAERRAA